MYPILIEIGEFQVASWYLAYAAGAILCWWLLHRWRKSLLPELSDQHLDMFFVLAYCGGFLGARGLSLIVEPAAQESSWTEIFQLGSMTLYGGLLGGAVPVIAYARYLRLPLLGLGDLILPPLLLAIGIGRVGCFLNGDDYGKILANQLDPPWWAVRFPNLDGLYRYPVQLMEAGAACLIAALAHYWRPRDTRGLGADVCIYGYASSRFVLEWWRGDERGILFSALLSPAQWLSLGILGLWSLYRLRGKRA